MLFAPSPSLASVCSLSTGELHHSVWGSVSGSGGIEGLVSDAPKDLEVSQ